jgi:hypothetical protein
MNTGGYGNDSLMIVAPIAIAIVVGVILFGGPTNALEALDAMVREIAYQVMTLVSALV